jgi:uncharacterized protein (TIRG00374 family)
MTWLKRAFAVLLFGVLIYFFLPLLTEVRAAASLLKTAQWSWLVIALLIQFVSYGFLTWLNQLALRPFGGKIGFWHLGAVLTAMAFIQIAIPSGGASGAALRVRLLGRYGYAPEDSLFSLFIETFSELIALASIALLGVAYLLQRGQMSMNELSWGAVIVIALSLLVWLVWRLMLDEARSRQILTWVVGHWNRRLARVRLLDAGHLTMRLSNFRTNLQHYRKVPAWKFILASYGKVLLDVACLGAGFLLFRYAISPGTLFTGYGLILTFSGAAALPGGLTAGDAAVPVVFSWLRVPGAVALASGLTYRLIAFWLVRFVGFIAWQYLESRPRTAV